MCGVLYDVTTSSYMMYGVIPALCHVVIIMPPSSRNM